MLKKNIVSSLEINLTNEVYLYVLINVYSKSIQK